MSETFVILFPTKTRTVSLSNRRIFIFEDDEPVGRSPTDTILEM